MERNEGLLQHEKNEPFTSSIGYLLRIIKRFNAGR